MVCSELISPVCFGQAQLLAPRRPSLKLAAQGNSRQTTIGDHAPDCNGLGARRGSADTSLSARLAIELLQLVNTPDVELYAINVSFSAITDKAEFD